MAFFHRFQSADCDCLCYGSTDTAKNSNRGHCRGERPIMKNDFEFNFGICALTCAVGLTLGLSAAEARAQTNLIANGSFEAGPAGEGKFTDWGWLGPADNFSNYGVAQSGVYPDVAQQGNYYAYFRGLPT